MRVEKPQRGVPMLAHGAANASATSVCETLGLNCKDRKSQRGDPNAGLISATLGPHIGLSGLCEIKTQKLFLPAPQFNLKGLNRYHTSSSRIRHERIFEAGET